MSNPHDSDPRAAATLAAVPEDSEAFRMLSVLDWEPTRDPMKVRALCPECDHRSLPYEINPESFTMRGKCQCDHCSYSDWGGASGGVFDLSWCRNPSAPVTYDTASGDLALHRVACGSRRGDPEGCGRFYEVQWASLIANTLRDGAWIGVAQGADRGRLQKAANRKGAKWFALPHADGQLVYVCEVELPKLEMVWVESGELFAKAGELTKQIPHDDGRRVSHSKSITSWRKRRESDVPSSRQWVGFASKSWQSLELVADTTGIEAKSDALLVLSEAERDSDAGERAMAMAGVTLHAEALESAVDGYGEAVSTRAETVRGDSNGAPALPVASVETVRVPDDPELAAAFDAFFESYTDEPLRAPRITSERVGVSVSTDEWDSPDWALWALPREPELVGYSG